MVMTTRRNEDHDDVEDYDDDDTDDDDDNDNGENDGDDNDDWFGLRLYSIQSCCGLFQSARSIQMYKLNFD